MKKTRLWMVLAFIATFITTIGPSAAQKDSNAAAESATQILATQIRAQGYACDEPSNAKRDEGASKADQAAWILTCKNATYRVRLIPDMAAQVEQLN